jgi:S1-C subfamily serine protease
MAVLDEFPFPLGAPMAQELLRTMADLYDTERATLRFVARFGIAGREITRGLPAEDLWQDLLTMLARKGTLREAVHATRDAFPRNPNAPLLNALLADDPGADNAAGVLPPKRAPVDFDASITAKDEALLFRDDLTMGLGDVPKLIDTLNRMLMLAPAVCLLRAQNANAEQIATGFRITTDLVLSNHHVLCPAGSVATKVVADFGFEVDADGKSLPVTSLVGTADAITGEKADDWAVVRIGGMQPEWPVVPLDDAPAPKVGDRAYILQHPNARQKRLGFVRNAISDVDERSVRYLTDTEPGSSGSPVFDSHGRLIALHRSGGEPIKVAGQLPIAKNEGIRINRVLERLKASKALQ